MNKERFEKRVLKFQELMKEKHIDVTMIRDSYAYTYFTGIKWDPPALMIPSEGEPVIFAIDDEIDELKENTWIDKIFPYRDVKTLISGVHNKVNMEVIGFNLDIDASALLYDMFSKIHSKKQVIDVHQLIMKLRMFKDNEEIETIKKAGKIAAIGMQTAIEAIKSNATELDIAAEAEYKMRKAGAEDIFIYVNTGSPRIHARPRDKKIKDYVLIDIMPSYKGYFYDMARTIILTPDTKREKALKAMEEIHIKLSEFLEIDNVFNSVETKILEVFKKYGLEDEYIYGFGHGVGLRYEETPILTIVPGDRMKLVKPNMVISAGHAPLSSKELGTIKIEDTHLIKETGGSERLVDFPLIPSL
jgi:Xaa-Pro aminopeptidase